MQVKFINFSWSVKLNKKLAIYKGFYYLAGFLDGADLALLSDCHNVGHRVGHVGRLELDLAQVGTPRIEERAGQFQIL